jgi:glutaredoxin
LCALCKRSSRPAPPKGETVSPLARFVTSVLGVLALAAVGVALSGALGLVELDLLVPEWLRSGPIVQTEIKQPAVRSAPRPLQDLVQKSPTQLAAEQLAQQIAQQQQQLAEAAAASSPEELERKLQAVVTPQQASEQDRRDRERHEKIEADIAERALKRAREKVSITMYSTTWCPSCVAARKYMTEKSIAFTEHDIEQSPSARDIQKRLNPKGSIPTIDVEGAVLVGFSSESLEHMIDAAARKRAR